jgi:hypothetical protein
MKIIHATWEQRNLGVDCYEVVLEARDTLDMLKEKAPEYETEYIVIKVPTGMLDICFYLQSVGYTFMEVITSCYHYAQLPVLTRIQQRMVDSVSCEKMNDIDQEQLFNEIRCGMFKNDRISLDPYFTQALANNRYIGWISDEATHGSQLFKLVYKGETAGFFVLKNQGNSNYHACIGGIYPNFQKFGFGLCLNYYEIYEGIKQNAKRIMGAYSSNNREASAIHLSIGYILDEQYYVFISHKQS